MIDLNHELLFLNLSKNEMNKSKLTMTIKTKKRLFKFMLSGGRLTIFLAIKNIPSNLQKFANRIKCNLKLSGTKIKNAINILMRKKTKNHRKWLD